MPNKPMGCIPSEYDPRDYSVAFTGKYGKLTWPESDLIPDPYENYDQDAGTCVAQSLRYGPHRHYKIPFGVNFIYGLARPAVAINMPGLSMKIANEFFVEYGLAPLSVDPVEYEVPKACYKAKADQAKLTEAASPYKGWTYARLYTIDEIKAAIRDRRHITFRMEVSRNGLDKANWFRGDGKNSIGHHAMVIRGYAPKPTVKGNILEAVIIRNSWGEKWGIEGDCYMTWEAVLAKNEIYVFFPPTEKEPIPVPVIVPRRTLRLGMAGDDVKEAQALLSKHGFWPTSEPNGTFDSTMRKYVLMFQNAKGLVADAIIGAKTWAALDAQPSIEPDNEFLNYLKARVGDIYVWGAQGQNSISEAWIKKMETSSSNATKAIKLWNDRVKYNKEDLRAFDCSGLIMYYLQNLKQIYKYDMSANSLYNKSKKIKAEELKPCDLVFRHNGAKAHHVGVYIGSGKVIEAKGREDGVVMRDLDLKYWNKFGRLDVLEKI